MTPKPILFLDVDGVLNCFDEKHGTIIHAGTPDRACVPEGTDLRIELLMKHFDIVWATAWFGAAHHAFGEYLRLPHEPFEFLSWHQYKLTEITKYANGRAWAWADDDIDFELHNLNWDEKRYLPDNAHLQRINPNLGLTDKDTAELLEFARQHA